MTRALVAVLVSVGLSSASCGPSHPIPVSDLAQSRHAMEEFQPIVAKWERGDTKERIALIPILARHAKVHAADPTARTATSMLALAKLLHGDTDVAVALTAPIVAGPEGATKDMALVTLGVAERRHGRAKRALALLEPLFGKLLDPCARNLLAEEIAVAAIDAGKLDDAVRYLRAWIVRANEDERAAIERRVEELIERLPKDPLVRLVESAAGTDEMKSSLLRITARRLATLAIETHDAVLAKLLVSKAGPLLGDRADDVARVAARSDAIRLEPNTVGLVLSDRGPEQRRRGLEVAEGLAIALGLPGSKARLVSRDDQGDPARIDEALALLNADGAAVIVAGVDARESDAAFDYAERTGVPMVLLRPPHRVIDPAGHVFVLGDDPMASRAALVSAAIGAGKDRIALLVGDRDESDAPPPVSEGGVVAVQPCGAPLDFARAAGAEALVVDAGPVCTRESADAAGLSIGVGLDAPSDLAARFRAKAGRFPVTSGSASGDADLVTFFARSAEPPTWWAGLGHDAGKLAWAAVGALPDSAPTDSQGMSARKAQVAKLLAAAEGELWTTSARGFGGGRTLARDVTVEDRGARPGEARAHEKRASPAKHPAKPPARSPKR